MTNAKTSAHCTVLRKAGQGYLTPVHPRIAYGSEPLAGTGVVNGGTSVSAQVYPGGVPYATGVNSESWFAPGFDIRCEDRLWLHCPLRSQREQRWTRWPLLPIPLFEQNSNCQSRLWQRSY